MRHAKSDWDADYGADHDRPLNDRGARSAEAMGRALVEERLVPGLVLSSTAVRARSTAELAIEAGGWDCETRLDPRLYGNGPDTAVEVAASAPPVGRLMMVGHQPTLSLLVQALTGEGVEIKTATVVVVEVPGEVWSDIGRGGELSRVLRPRDYV